jgi:hypothetical protein
MHDDEQQIWIDAAVFSLGEVGADADAETIELVAGVIEELASAAPQDREEMIEVYSGHVHAALMDWIADSYDEDDEAEHKRLRAEAEDY